MANIQQEESGGGGIILIALAAIAGYFIYNHVTAPTADSTDADHQDHGNPNNGTSGGLMTTGDAFMDGSITLPAGQHPTIAPPGGYFWTPQAVGNPPADGSVTWVLRALLPGGGYIGYVPPSMDPTSVLGTAPGGNDVMPWEQPFRPRGPMPPIRVPGPPPD